MNLKTQQKQCYEECLQQCDYIKKYGKGKIAKDTTMYLKQQKKQKKKPLN